MSYLLDTDQVVAYLKNRPDTIKLLTSLSGAGLAISLVSYGEIYEGIYFGKEREKHEKGFLAFLRQADVIPMNRRIMKRFARIRGELRATGSIIGDADILIAATAIDRNLTLVTGNKRHFERVPGLTLYK